MIVLKQHITGSRCLLLSVIALLFFVSANITAAEKYFYKWVDENGVVHVTDKPENVPEEHRQSATEYSKKELSNYSKLKNYSKKLIISTVENVNILIGLFAGIIFLFFLRKITVSIPKYLKNRKKEMIEKTVLESGIKKMDDDDFKNSVKSALLKSGYSLKPFDSQFGSMINFIAVKKRKKYAVHISTDLNYISALKIKDIEKERQNSQLDSSIVVANTRFEKPAEEFAKKNGCKTVDEYGIAKAVIKSGKIEKL